MATMSPKAQAISALRVPPPAPRLTPAQPILATNDGREVLTRPLDWPIISWFTALHAIALIGPFFATSTGAVVTAVILYYATGMLGITLGYHRLLSHRSFKTPRWVERVLATIGSLALQRGPVDWIAHHRMHHAFTDRPGDPHNARLGFWWSHLGWMCRIHPELRDVARARRFARDITADPYMVWLNHDWVHMGLQVALGVLLLVFGGIDYVIWGIFVRTAVVYHATWFVNSATHKYGYQTYDNGDLSRNCWWVGILAFGEGWHNNHHAFPDVAPAGHRKREVDLTWYVIKGMRALGLARDIKMPDSNR